MYILIMKSKFEIRNILNKRKQTLCSKYIIYLINSCK